MAAVLHHRLPRLPWMEPALARLPGVLPLDMADWLEADAVFAGQMALRDGLLADRRDAVYAMTDGAGDASCELLALILTHLGPGYSRKGDEVERPDGVVVALDADAPLVTAARLVQEDLCLHQRGTAGEHVLTGAVLCFPASWSLAEKIGRPLSAIHGPVPAYDAGLAARVQRLFDGIRPGRPLWRQNALVYGSDQLHHPRTEAAPRREALQAGRYVRSEKQCLLRLPKSDAVVFSIHTYLAPLDSLPADARAALLSLHGG
ncbi:DUF3445 domain-containing protein [Rhodobacterales bacterium LSUCC0031]|nr:DUF3445 domain-containing protein [Rhodobacterales bacterium LSUCC0031]